MRQVDHIEELNSSYSEGWAGIEDRAPADWFPPGAVARSASVSRHHLSGNNSATLTSQRLPGEHVLTIPRLWQVLQRTRFPRVDVANAELTAPTFLLTSAVSVLSFWLLPNPGVSWTCWVHSPVKRRNWNTLTGDPLKHETGSTFFSVFSWLTSRHWVHVNESGRYDGSLLASALQQLVGGILTTLVAGGSADDIRVGVSVRTQLPVLWWMKRLRDPSLGAPSIPQTGSALN